MAYLHLLASWRNQDYEAIEEIIDDKLIATFVKDDGSIVRLNKQELLAIFKKRFERNQDWNFEVIYKGKKRQSDIVILTISREDENFNLIEDKSICTLVFRKKDDIHKLKRMTFEMGIIE
ncbi:hypothetical protein [Macrococcus armenti]|uniref:hypothetical protein n=1 Tax=Macrococcus armenti TaxID=2875764 RepID=UPI001CCE0FED|nr:hypothetical protein [Macrococcus armenti]UBH07901.1 hypothetical protein LAU41_07655 [Macrococcus armenti]UBH10136.1 hypothetical protein LAU38_07580 [Macrococcus armenti]UBH14623.1 hypothetical protein LAU44_07535 [Macrococcus armenti]UBH16983.1 hypothetical protein LAU39_07560 [Macrococcus armenti]UBH19247.1 hypothetical protein LAU40_07540 [Macrococcus armenti]